MNVSVQTKIRVMSYNQMKRPNWVYRLLVGKEFPLAELDKTAVIYELPSFTSGGEGYAVRKSDFLAVIRGRDILAVEIISGDLPVDATHVVFGRGYCEIVRE